MRESMFSILIQGIWDKSISSTQFGVHTNTKSRNRMHKNHAILSI